MSTKIKSILDGGQYVILRKSPTSDNPTSYSLVKRYEGSKVWRTPFEANKRDEVYDFETGKFTFEHIDNNPRISFYKAVDWDNYAEDFDDEDDYILDDEDEYPPVRRTAVPTAAPSNDAYYISKIRELELEIVNMQMRQLQQASTPKVVASKKPRRSSVSV